MKPIEAIVYYKLFLVKLGITTTVIIAAAIAAALSGVDNWGALTHTQQLIIVCGIVSVAGTNLISMLDKTFATLSNGQNAPLTTPPQTPTIPPNNGGTPPNPPNP